MLSTALFVSTPFKSTKLNSGFTLIEILVVTSLTVVLLVGTSVFFLTFLIASAKVNVQQTVKSQGNQAIGQVQFLLRNALSLEDYDNDGVICQEGMSKIDFRGADGGITVLQAVQESGIYKIASQSATTGQNYFLTSNQVDLQQLSGGRYLEFDCYGGRGSSYYIDVKFRLQKTSSNELEGSPALQDFQAGVVLRN